MNLFSYAYFLSSLMTSSLPLKLLQLDMNARACPLYWDLVAS